LKIAILGIGAVGSVTATHLAKSPKVSELVLGDIYLDKAKEIAKKLDSEKISVMRVNAQRREDLTKVLEKKDAVINAALPKYNESIMDVALKNRVHYIDLASDLPWDSVRRQLSHDNAWKAANLIAIMGLGEDPGMSNIFARHIADKLDQASEIRIRDGDNAFSKEFAFPCLFSPDVLIDEVFNPPATYEDGVLHKLSPLSGEEVYKFPEPIGPLTVYNVDHEETETLPKFLDKGIHYVDFKLAFSPQTVEMLKILKQLNLTSKEPITVKGVKIAPRDVLLALLPKPANLAGKVEGYSCIAVDIKGERAGEKVHALAYTFMSHQVAYEKYGVTATAYLTGTPPAIGAEMMEAGEIEIRGVFPPECIEPEPFLTRLADKGIAINETINKVS